MRWLPLTLVLLVGCDAPVPYESAPVVTARRPTLEQWTGPTGTLAGQVRWMGPRIEPTMVETYRPAPGGRADRVSRAAPNLPVIDPAAGGVAGAIVYLRGVSATARPWDHPPVALELNDAWPMIKQGDGPPRTVGLAQRGDSITITSRQSVFHAVRARGAAFWTFMLPDADKPLTRRLDQPGIVELSSAAGYYWMHAYLLVCDHPYCAITDAAGRFEIPRTPAGDYELMAWLPSWDVIRRERDPESTAVTRIVFGPHHEWRRFVSVKPGESAGVEVRVP